jgi:hypothetical protein
LRKLLLSTILDEMSRNYTKGRTNESDEGEGQQFVKEETVLRLIKHLLTELTRVSAREIHEQRVLRIKKLCFE